MKSLLLFVVAQLFGVLVTWVAFCALNGSLAALSHAMEAAKTKRYIEELAFSVPFTLIVCGVAAVVLWLKR